MTFKQEMPDIQDNKSVFSSSASKIKASPGDSYLNRYVKHFGVVKNNFSACPIVPGGFSIYQTILEHLS